MVYHGEVLVGKKDKFVPPDPVVAVSEMQWQERIAKLYRRQVALSEKYGTPMTFVPLTREEFAAAMVEGKCNAINKTTGRPCMSHPVPGAQRCASHGGVATLAIVKARESALDREASKGNEIAKKARFAATDPELVGMRKQLGVLEALYESKLAMVDACGGQVAWKRVKEAWDKLEAAFSESDAGKLIAARKQLSKAVAQGCEGFGAEKEIREIFQEMTVLSNTEIRRQKALGEMFSVTQMNALVNACATLINEEMPPEGRARAYARLLEISNRTIGEPNKDPGPGVRTGRHVRPDDPRQEQETFDL